MLKTENAIADSLNFVQKYQFAMVSAEFGRNVSAQIADWALLGQEKFNAGVTTTLDQIIWKKKIDKDEGWSIL